MATRLGTSLAALLGRFGVTTTVAGSLDLQEDYNKRTAELLADEAEHERALTEQQLNAVTEPVSPRDRCPALSEIVTGWPCKLKNGHPHSFQHDWEIGGARS